ncbi:hypothetical protein ACIFOE_20550 [Paenibacillus sp. NRS-1783]|uniref:hypothetical protein n=1 Tax=Paenibacillus sp. NRS-1783 TaxID=3233907 RepID=UPI003D26A775
MKMINEIKVMLPKILELIELLENYNKEIRGEIETHHNTHQKILSILTAWEHHDLLLLESIMYIGQSDFVDRANYDSEYEYYQDIENIRGHYYSPEESLENMYNYLLELKQPYGVLIDHMLAKLLLPRYLKQGLDVLRIKRIEEFSA